MTIEEVINIGVHKIMYNVDNSAVPFVEKYQEVFNEQLSCNTCAGVLYEAYFKLKNHMKAKTPSVDAPVAQDEAKTPSVDAPVAQDEAKTPSVDAPVAQDEAKEQEYTIVDGVVIDLSFSPIFTGAIFTAENITDEAAKALLAENEAYAQWIVKK